MKGLLADPNASPAVKLKAYLAVITRRDWVIAKDVKRALDFDINSQFASLERNVKNPFTGDIMRPIRQIASGQ